MSAFIIKEFEITDDTGTHNVVLCRGHYARRVGMFALRSGRPVRDLVASASVRCEDCAARPLTAREINAHLRRDARSVFCFIHERNPEIYRVQTARTRACQLEVRVTLEGRESWVIPFDVWVEQ
jgi:hypothetical protein